MEGNIFVLFAFVILGTLFVLAIILHTLFGKSSSGTERSSASSTFVRENSVSGYLKVEGKQIPTFNSGTLVLDELVSITFYNSFNRPVVITDIELNDISIYSFSTGATSYREKADYAIQVLKQTANQGTIPRSTVHVVEQTILDVDSLNEHIKAGHIKQVIGDDFIWKG